MPSDTPPPNDTTFATSDQLTTEVAFERLTEEGYNPRSKQEKSKYWNEVDIQSASVGENRPPNVTFVQIHQFPNPSIAESKYPEIERYNNEFDPGLRAVFRTFVIGNLIVYIRSPNDGANGSDIEGIAKAIAGD